MVNPCEKCPLRLFADKGYPIKGSGNKAYGNIIVLPTIDKNAYKKQDITFDNMVTILQESIFVNTSYNLLDFCYVTTLVKCTENKSCPVTSEIKLNCFDLFIEEIRNVPIRNMLFLGKQTYSLFINIQKYRIEHNMRFITCNIPNAFWNFSPGIKFYDDKKFDMFEKELIQWFIKVIH